MGPLLRSTSPLTPYIDHMIHDVVWEPMPLATMLHTSKPLEMMTLQPTFSWFVHQTSGFWCGGSLTTLLLTTGPMLAKMRGPAHLRFSFPDGFRGERERGVRDRSFLEDELEVFLSGLLKNVVMFAHMAVFHEPMIDGQNLPRLELALLAIHYDENGHQSHSKDLDFSFFCHYLFTL